MSVAARARARWIVWLPVLIAVWSTFWFWGTGPVDDDYICYRYAQNWIAGNGLVYTPGEWVEGFTTPLWVVWLALWQWVGGDPVQGSLAAGIGAFLLLVGFCARWEARRGRIPGVAIVLASTPALAWHTMAGLGTVPMALALLFAGLSSLERDAAGRLSKPWRVGLALATAVALRQEFALFLLPLWFAEPSASKDSESGLGSGSGSGWLDGNARHRLPIIGPSALVVLVWSLVRLLYYERWLPMTYVAKKLPVAADLEYGANYLWEATLNLGWLGLLGLAIVFAWRQRDRLLACWTLGIAAHTAYVVWVGGDFMVLSRFFVPVFPLLLVLVWHAAPWPREARGRIAWVLPSGLALVCALALQWNQVGDRIESRDTRLLIQQGFKQRWARLGEHFGATFEPSTKVALSPIGAFGWHSGLHILDILGLVNESVIGVEPDLDFIQVKGHHRANFDWILDQDPEYVILGNGVRSETGSFIFCPWEKGFYESIQARGRFPRRYRQATMDVGDGQPLDLFVRRDLELPPATQWVAP